MRVAVYGFNLLNEIHLGYPDWDLAHTHTTRRDVHWRRVLIE